MKKINQFWNVRLFPAKGRSPVYLGVVLARDEQEARHVALSRFGRADDDPADPRSIGLDDEFEVSPRL